MFHAVWKPSPLVLNGRVFSVPPPLRSPRLWLQPPRGPLWPAASLRSVRVEKRYISTCGIGRPIRRRLYNSDASRIRPLSVARNRPPRSTLRLSQRGTGEPASLHHSRHPTSASSRPGAHSRASLPQCVASAAAEPGGSSSGPQRSAPSAVTTNLWYPQYFGVDQLTAADVRLGLAFLRATYRGDVDPGRTRALGMCPRLGRSRVWLRDALSRDRKPNGHWSWSAQNSMLETSSDTMHEDAPRSSSTVRATNTTDS